MFLPIRYMAVFAKQYLLRVIYCENDIRMFLKVYRIGQYAEFTEKPNK